MAKINRRSLHRITFNERMIAKKDTDTVTVWLPGTSRKELITIPYDHLIQDGKTWHAWLGEDAEQVITDRRGRYVRRLLPDQIYDYFSPPDIDLTSLVKQRMPFTPGVTDAQRRYYAVQAVRLDRLRDSVRELNAAQRWLPRHGNDLDEAIRALGERIRTERDSFTSAVAALSEAADHAETAGIDDAKEQRQLSIRERRIGELQADLKALQTLQKRVRDQQEQQRRSRTKTRGIRR